MSQYDWLMIGLFVVAAAKAMGYAAWLRRRDNGAAAAWGILILTVLTGYVLGAGVGG